MDDIPVGFCQCGCGERTKIADRNHYRDGWIKGQSIRFIAGHQVRLSPVEYLIDEKSGCWIWQRWVHPVDGYGYMPHPITKKTRVAHRVIYERHKGPIPKGLDLDHLCRVRKCVNPDHLEPVTRRENLARGIGGLNNFKKKNAS